jgi:hypothetical protein
MSKFVIKSFFVILLSIIFVACESSSTSPTNKTGYLIDNALGGISYSTSSGKSGITSANGEFEFSSIDTTIIFSIGGLQLPTFNLENLNSDGKILPTDLLGVDRNDSLDANVTKILQVLQSLDDDNNLDNGIYITQNTKNLFTNTINVIDKNATELSILLGSKGITMREASNARAHFEKTLRDDFGYENNTTSNNDTFHHEGTWKNITYKTITSPHTGRVWLDRNLGASQVCTESRDSVSFNNDSEYVTSQQNCFGDYYQFGRDADGHEKYNSPTTTTLASNIDLTVEQNIVDNNGSFIINSSPSEDWIDVNGNDIDDNGVIRSTLWSKTDGSSICPIGFRVPTFVEIQADTIALTGDYEITNRDDLFNNFLKLPISGVRESDSGNISNQGNYLLLWSTSILNTDVSTLVVSSTAHTVGSTFNIAAGLVVRCIRDEGN